MFGEKKQEKNRAGQTVDVWVLPKYEQSKAKALEIIDKYDNIGEGDFWILKNETKSGTVMYSGLIISHNACLKINDALAEKDRFRPDCVTVDKAGYDNSLVYTYCCPEQGIYEVGEASPKNCKQAYPYAMAFKRCYDRMVLKASKLAYDGIYSENEADTFSRAENASEAELKALGDKITKTHMEAMQEMISATNTDIDKLLEYYGVDALQNMTEAQYGEAMGMMIRKKAK